MKTTLFTHHGDSDSPSLHCGRAAPGALVLVVSSLMSLACGGLGGQDASPVPAARVDQTVTVAPPTPTHPVSPPVAALPLHGESAGLGWVDQYQRPAVADVDEDGVDDLVALYIDGSDPRERVYVGVFSGDGLRKLWSHGPIGEREADTRNIGVSVARGKVVVQEPFGHLRVFAAATGEELAEFQLEQRPSGARMCGPVGEETEVVVDRSLAIDLVSLQSRPAGRRSAARCGSGKDSRHASGDSTEGAEHFAAWDGGWASGPIVMRTERHRVDWRVARPGQPEPQLVGVDLQTGHDTWRLPMASATARRDSWRDDRPDYLDIVGDKVVVLYQPENESFATTHVVAIDADTGRVRFDVPIHSGSTDDQVTLTQTHAYIVGLSWPAPTVSAVDLQTGQLSWVFGGP